MITNKLSFLLLILALFVSACSGQAGQAPATVVATQVAELVDAKSTIQALEIMATAANLKSSPTPTQTLPPSAVPSIAPTEMAPTFTATSGPKYCLDLIYPLNGEWVRAYGYLLFRWETWPDAASYRLQITVPTGWVMSVDLESASQNRYMPTLASEGEYTWRVAALDADGEVICQSAPFTFQKQYSRPGISSNDDRDCVLASGA